MAVVKGVAIVLVASLLAPPVFADVDAQVSGSDEALTLCTAPIECAEDVAAPVSEQALSEPTQESPSQPQQEPPKEPPKEPSKDAPKEAGKEEGNGARDAKDKDKKKSEIKPYDTVITETAVTKKGVFTAHKVDDKLYFEIPRDRLGQEFLWVTQLAKTAAGYGLGGTGIADRVVRFEMRL